MSEMIDKFYKAIDDIKNMFTVAQAMAENSFKVSEENTRLREALERIDNWAKAYPLKVFPEPDLKKVAEVLKAAGLSLDAVSASNMRHVINQVKDITKQALKE